MHVPSKPAVVVDVVVPASRDPVLGGVLEHLQGMRPHAALGVRLELADRAAVPQLPGRRAPLGNVKEGPAVILERLLNILLDIVLVVVIVVADVVGRWRGGAAHTAGTSRGGPADIHRRGRGRSRRRRTATAGPFTGMGSCRRRCRSRGTALGGRRNRSRRTGKGTGGRRRR